MSSVFNSDLSQNDFKAKMSVRLCTLLPTSPFPAMFQMAQDP